MDLEFLPVRPALCVLYISLFVWVSVHVQWVIVSQVVTQLLALVVSTYFSMRLVPALRLRRQHFNWPVARDVLSFGAWNSLGQTAVTLRQTADAPILFWLSTPLQVNAFFLGSYVDTKIREFMTMVWQPTVPALTAMHALGQKERLAAFFIRGCRLSLWMVLFLILPFMVFRNEIWQLYLGTKFETLKDVIPITLLLLSCYIVVYPTAVLTRICTAKGEIRQVTWRLITIHLTNLSLTLLLVGVFRMGALGSAWATSMSVLVLTPPLFWKLSKRMIQFSTRSFFVDSILPGTVPFLVAFGVSETIRRNFLSATIGHTIGGICTSAILYMIVAYLCSHPIDKQDARQVYRSLSRQIRPIA